MNRGALAIAKLQRFNAICLSCTQQQRRLASQSQSRIPRAAQQSRTRYSSSRLQATARLAWTACTASRSFAHVDSSKSEGSFGFAAGNTNRQHGYAPVGVLANGYDYTLEWCMHRPSWCLLAQASRRHSHETDGSRRSHLRGLIVSFRAGPDDVVGGFVIGPDGPSGAGCANASRSPQLPALN